MSGAPTWETTTLLQLEDVVSFYGASQALFGVSLTVNDGEVVGLLGRNGMGKSTTVRSIFGLVTAAEGVIQYQGVALRCLRPHAIARLGIGLVPEGRQIFPLLTVEENLKATARPKHDRPAQWDLAKVYGAFPRLKERRLHLGSSLSGGEQQMLAIGRALMSRPKLMLLDEPSMGLAPLLVQKIFETIVAVAREGVTILLVEQNARLALEVSSRGYVMETGLITLSGPARELLVDPKVRAAYLGEAD